MKLRVFAPFVLACSSVAARASADEASRLFDEAVVLLDQGKFAEACPKLEESRKLDPAAGTLLNLASCYERSGRKALALATFREAAVAAKGRGRADWERVAETHVRDLERTLPTLDVVLEKPDPNVEVAIDGHPIAPGELGVRRWVDPGSHSVTAHARGKRPYAEIFDVRAATHVSIPVLAVETAKPSSPAKDDTVPEPPAARSSNREIAGLAALGVGAAGVLFGAVSVIVARGALADAKASCPSYPDKCTADAEDPNSRAQTWSTIATVSFIAGGVFAATGGVLLLWPSSGRSDVKVGTTGTDLFVRGRF